MHPLEQFHVSSLPVRDFSVALIPVRHVVIAFLPVLAYVLVRDRELPSLRLVAIVAVGSLFPDLIDKPLAYEASLIPSPRVFMHSLPFAVPLVGIVCVYAWKTDRKRAGGVFAFAYFSHLVADNYEELAGPEAQIPSDLLWPFLPPVSRPAVPYWAGPDQVNVHLWTVVSLAVLAVLAYAVASDVRRQFGS